MRRASLLFTAMLIGLPSLALGFSGPTPGKADPQIVSYRCADGSAANVVYEHGGDYLHARALVTHDGRTLELPAAPALYGVRFHTRVGESETSLAWSLRGEEARLTEYPAADDETKPGRELLRCARVRNLAAAGDHGAGGDHHDEH